MEKMNTRMQIICAWMGPAFIVVLLPAWFMMGFLPPVPPMLSIDELVAHYENHRTEIRLGAMLTMQFCMFGVAWTAAIAAQMRRIETGPSPVLTYLQLTSGTVGFFVFVFTCFAWGAAAYRPDMDPQLLKAMNDYAWLSLVMPVMLAFLQSVSIGLVILSDQRKHPIFPRWAAYANFWAGVTFLPGSLATFFKTGPFAWNGIFVFWLPLAMFTAWIFLMAILVTKAARRQQSEMQLQT